VTQADITGRGHAIECRLYAEDPAADFGPSPGKIEYLREPFGPGVRHDCGVRAGFVVPFEYDPILSKLIVWAENRPAAIDRMRQALADTVFLGVATTVPFLADVLDSAPFRAGETYTDFIPTHFADWRPSTRHDDLAALAFVAHALFGQTVSAAAVPAEAGFVSPWHTLGSWRM
jgi:acetyl/propionyl-CoA carboxylase alpha subunit